MINIRDYHSIVVLTGAGISAESGVKTFRDDDGLWNGYKVEKVATPEAFDENPNLVNEFYNLRRQQLISSVKPNDAHIALAEFSHIYTGNFTLVTQNVDNLHEQGGSEHVLHMHGELLKARCVNTEQIFNIDSPIDPDTKCQCCQRSGTLRPHIVWFGEMPLYLEEIEKRLLECDLFIAIGTSGQVYPAAGFVQMASMTDATTVELNLKPSDVHSSFNHAYYGPATQIVREFFS
ncbi:Sir2 family NAD+-dependent deacetylase [Agarilytica rhodophyticola]|uniref:Sir2 family NAD+-dependent deacetylase n=1 Tax=Agarilytica rhodophyticola TaxID=1737490 RepID=UPI000B347972|nr:Sir2 family NAD+-dependent deacetylase [Agarilytica rhodophyticola]